MIIVSIILLVILGALLIGLGTIQPQHEVISQFELERLQTSGDTRAAQALRRESKLADIEHLLRLVTGVLLVFFGVTAVGSLDWPLGLLVAIGLALLYGGLGKINIIHTQFQRLYQRYESKILRGIDHIGPLLSIVRFRPAHRATLQLDSREQLQYLITRANGILSPEQKKLINQSLKFDERLVQEIMTPRAVIDSVSQTELLGPLVLNDLHKSGHSRFPVINQDIDHIVGMLHIQDLLAIHSGRGTTTVEKAMEPRVFYIHENRTLTHALTAFIKTRHHLFVVVNEFRETVGLLSLEDVIETLLGRKIIDEFDAHEDLQAVAESNPHHNNASRRGTDV